MLLPRSVGIATLGLESRSERLKVFRPSGYLGMRSGPYGPYGAFWIHWRDMGTRKARIECQNCKSIFIAVKVAYEGGPWPAYCGEDCREAAHRKQKRKYARLKRAGAIGYSRCPKCGKVGERREPCWYCTRTTS